MAMTQTITAGSVEQAKGPAVLAKKDDAGLYYTEIGGGLRRYVGEGVPAHAAPVGSLAHDVTAGSVKLYICTVATGTWLAVTAS